MDNHEMISLFYGVAGVTLSADGRKTNLYKDSANLEDAVVVDRSFVVNLIKELITAGLNNEKDPILRTVKGSPPLTFRIVVVGAGINFTKTFYNASEVGVPQKYLDILDRAEGSVKSEVLQTFIKKNRKIMEK